MVKSLCTNNTPSSSRSSSPSGSRSLSKASFLRSVLVFICFATTTLFFNLDKQMNKLTRKMEGDIEKTFEEHLLRSSRSPLNDTTTTASAGSYNNDNTLQLSPAQQQQEGQQQEGEGHSPYAYMFLIGGIDPAKPGYRGFLYNVMIAADLLRRHGSKADVWLYLQLSPNTNATVLPPKETQALDTLGIHVHYMEKPETASFTDINMEKFRLLQMTQYKRVLFLDADVLPLVNMDYLMELSDGDRPLLQPNFVVATLGEPANGGCFMLEPKPGAYEELLQVVQRQRESAKDLGYPYFDRIKGWGHSFEEYGDEWKGTTRTGSKWRWHGAHVDQGLLFYWTKYHKQAVTIFRGHTVENFVPGKDGQPFLQASMDPSFIDQYAPKDRVTHQWSCDLAKNQGDHLCKTPYYNYAHFTGEKKPWQQGYDPRKMATTHHGQVMGPYRVYFQTLFDLSQRLNLDITPENVDDKFKGDSPLGYLPNYGDFAKRQQNWDEQK